MARYRDRKYMKVGHSPLLKTNTFTESDRIIKCLDKVSEKQVEVSVIKHRKSGKLCDLFMSFRALKHASKYS